MTHTLQQLQQMTDSQLNELVYWTRGWIQRRGSWYSIYNPNCKVLVHGFRKSEISGFCNDLSYAPTTDWRDAGELVEEVRERGWYISIDTDPKEPHSIVFDREGGYWIGEGNTDSPTRAITMAWILAMQEQTNENS